MRPEVLQEPRIRETYAPSSTEPEAAITSTLVGRDGWLFSRQNAQMLYARDARANSCIDQWKDELKNRTARLSEMGCRYSHVVVPDKASMMHEHLDGLSSEFQVQDRYSPLAEMTKNYKAGLPCLISPAAYLERQKGSYPLHWQSDTRWTPWSAYMTCQLLCSSLGVTINNQLLGYPYSEAVRPMNLDNGQVNESSQQTRLYRYWLRSKTRFENELVALRKNSFDDGSARLSEAEFAEGAHVVYENHHEKASRFSVVIFGDENSADSRSLMTGMLAETFSEVHFVWADGIDYNYVDRVRPDIVITQNQEISLFNNPERSIDMRALEVKSLNNLLDWKQLATVGGHDDADREQETNNSVVLNTAVASSRVLLQSERYDLDLPVMVQQHSAHEAAETYMQSNEVTLHDVPFAQVYFTGPSWWVHDKAGSEILRHGIPDDQKPAGLWRRGKRFKGTTLMLATSAGAHCYYHWMTEILPKFGLLERDGISLDSIDQVLVRQITGKWQLETLERFGFDKSRIVETVKQPNLRCDRLLHIDLNCGINLKMHRFIPQWMKHLFPAAPSDDPRIKLYISRPKGVRRGISNEEEFIPLLKAAGFTIKAMEGLSVAEQAALLSRADVVMSPHGGGLTNMVFCRPGVKIVEMFSRHVFPYYWGLAANCGHHYHAILENPQEDYPRLVDSKVAQGFADTQHTTAGLSFDVPIDAVKAVLDRI